MSGKKINSIEMVFLKSPIPSLTCSAGRSFSDPAVACFASELHTVFSLFLRLGDSWGKCQQQKDSARKA